MGGGILGGMFDFNRDGKMDAFERAAEFMFLNDVAMADNEDQDTDFSLDDDSSFEEDF